MADLFGAVCPCCGQAMPERIEHDTFETFWKKWPDKRGKDVALRAWKKLAAAEKKIAADRCEAWCHDWRKRNPQASHIMAATYLNQRRFMDMDDIPKADRRAPYEAAASRILTGKSFMCVHVTAAQAREAIAAGLVTEDDCRKVGVL